MGNSCANCCQPQKKKGYYYAHELEETNSEVIKGSKKLFFSNLNKKNLLTVVAEDTYESHNSHQNSLSSHQHIAANTSVMFNSDIANFWILDIQEQQITASQTSDSSHVIRVVTRFNELTKEFTFLKQEETQQPIMSLIDTNPKFKKIYPFLAQVKEIYESIFDKNKNNKIKNFSSGYQEEEDFSIFQAWEVLLEGIVKTLAIEPQCNLLVVNNLLRFSKKSERLQLLCERLLIVIFEKLSCSRFTLCSSGPPILKYHNRKTGLVFDISESGFVYCFPVKEGYSLDELSSIIYFPILKLNPSDEEQEKNISDREAFQVEIVSYLKGLDQGFLQACFRNKSIAINNMSNIDHIQYGVIKALNFYFYQLFQIQPEDVSTPPSITPLLSTSKESARLTGAMNLLKLNVLETISKSRFDRIGSQDLMKQNLFI